MHTSNQYKIEPRFITFILFTCLIMLAGCKPSIDSLDVTVTKNGQQQGEGRSISIESNELILEAISPADKLRIAVNSGDDKTAHISNHIFQWSLAGGETSEWQINGTEVGDLKGNFFETYSDKTIELTAPDGADSQITLKVTVTCDQVEGADKSTTLKIKIVSKRSIDEWNQQNATFGKKVRHILNKEKQSLIKAGNADNITLYDLIQAVTDDFLLEKETNLIDAHAKHKYARGLLERIERDDYIQEISSKILAADDHQTCVENLPKHHVHFDEQYDLQQRKHKALCAHGLQLKNSMEDTCILEVADRGTGDSVVLNCKPDKDNSSGDSNMNKVANSQGQFVPYLTQHKYFVNYALTENEKYIITGNVKDFPSILGYKTPAMFIDCELKKRDWCLYKRNSKKPDCWREIYGE